MNSSALIEVTGNQETAILVEYGYFLSYLCGLFLNALIIVLFKITNDPNVRVFGIITNIQSAINIFLCFIFAALKMVLI